MRDLKVAVNLSYVYLEIPSLLDKLAEAKRFGFQAAEFGSVFEYSVEDIQKAVEESGVDVVLFNMYPGSAVRGTAAIPGKEKEFRETLAKKITYAKALNCKQISIETGAVKSPTSEHHQVFMKNLHYAASVLEKENLIGLIEAISPESVPDYYLCTFPDALDAIKEISSPNLKLLLDMYHLQNLHGNLTKNLELYLPHTGHIQVSQVPGRHEPGLEGEIDYHYIFNLLRIHEFSGYVGLEYFPSKSTAESLKWLEGGEFEGLKICWD